MNYCNYFFSKKCHKNCEHNLMHKNEKYNTVLLRDEALFFYHNLVLRSFTTWLIFQIPLCALIKQWKLYDFCSKFFKMKFRFFCLCFFCKSLFWYRDEKFDEKYNNVSFFIYIYIEMFFCFFLIFWWKIVLKI